jgi:hypothetical protein
MSLKVAIMKKIIIAYIASTILISCQSTKDIEANLADKDVPCGKNCSEYFRICDNQTSATPIAHHNGCVDTFRYCVQTCPTKGSSSAATTAAVTSDKPSIADKLKELDSLHKQGLITDSEYANKKQEILKSM